MSQPRNNVFRAMALGSSISSQLAGSIIIGILTGHKIDQKIHTEPLFILIGLTLGLALGVFAVKQTLERFNSREENLK